MDSLTQIALGAAVSASLLGKVNGRKSLAVGAIVGTFPDLDVLIPMDGVVESFTSHRGFSHSFLFCFFITPVLTWLLSCWKWLEIDFKSIRSHIAVSFILITHIILDAFTVYGTQLFWPMETPPVAIGSIFIIDPLYTIPLLGFLIWFLCNRSHRAIYIGLVLSTLYLGWSLGAQVYVQQIAKTQIESDKILIQSTPFNTILWRVLVMEEGNYKVGYYSLFDKEKEINFETYQSNHDLLPHTPEAKRLAWFSHDFYQLTRNKDGDIIYADIRMGLEPNNYAFQFNLSETPVSRVESKRDTSRLSSLWNRMLGDF